MCVRVCVYVCVAGVDGGRGGSYFRVYMGGGDGGGGGPLFFPVIQTDQVKKVHISHQVSCNIPTHTVSRLKLKFGTQGE